jgi:hypothetical protein
LFYRLKLKRPQTAKKYRAQLDKMYEEALADEMKGKGVATIGMKSKL